MQLRAHAFEAVFDYEPLSCVELGHISIGTLPQGSDLLTPCSEDAPSVNYLPHCVRDETVAFSNRRFQHFPFQEACRQGAFELREFADRLGRIVVGLIVLPQEGERYEPEVCRQAQGHAKLRLEKP
jgi:hypothetical protein